MSLTWNKAIRWDSYPYKNYHVIEVATWGHKKTQIYGDFSTFQIQVDLHWIQAAPSTNHWKLMEKNSSSPIILPVAVKMEIFIF